MLKLIKHPSAIIFLTCAIILSIYNFVRPKLKYKHHLIVTKNETKYILFWMPMWDSKTFGFGSAEFELFKHCEFKNCYATHERMQVSLDKFDAIVFHGAQFDVNHEQPWIRNYRQMYVFASMEAPINEVADLTPYKSFYNWTMTYRFDSDIPRPYGYVVKATTNYTMPSFEFIENKTRLVAWLVSHCKTWNKREIVYRNLRQFLNIDVYGSCGNFTCPADQLNLRGPTSDCYDYFEQKYKFYLSFENAHCKDYVTEKLYMLLERNIVPIVYGQADYDAITPPKSVIVANKFKTIKQLVDYIVYLDQNPDEYLKYFEWKKSYYIARDGNRTVCKLCEKLNNPLERQTVYADIKTWWFGGQNSSNCVKSYDSLPSISLPLFNNSDIFPWFNDKNE